MSAYTLSTTEKYLPDLDALESKAICHSLDDFAFSKDPFSFDDSTMFREQSQAPLDDDEDDDAGFGAPQEDYGSSMNVDGDGAGPAPEEDFFAGNDPTDTFEDAAMSPEGMDDGATPSFDNDQFNAGPGGEQGGGAGTGNANGPYGPFDPRRIRSESDRVIAMTEGDGQGGMIELFDQAFLKNWAGPEHWKLRRVVKRRKRF